MYRRFVLIFTATLLLFSVLVVAPSALIMWNVYEFSNINRVVKDQASSHGIYASSLDHNAMSYKLSLIKYRKPDIVAIGSSRAMQFREDSFKDDIVFVNAGGAASSIEDMEAFVQEMMALHRPQAVILAVDFWWFNPNRRNPVRPIEGSTQSFDLVKVLRFWREVTARGIPKNISLLPFGPVRHSESGLNVLGLEAMYSSSGYHPDGSRLYFDIMFGSRNSPDIRFENTLRRIDQGSNRFEYGNSVSMKDIFVLQKLVDYLVESGVEVLVVIPPLAPSVVNYLNDRSELYGYLFDFLEMSDKMNWVNYHDVVSLGADDCEFIDGFHGGSVICHRMILGMSKRIEWLAETIDIDNLEAIVHQNTGRAYSLTNPSTELYGFKEKDFLGVGCQK